MASPLAEAPRAAAPLMAAAAGHGIPGGSIVVFREGADPRSVAAIAKGEPRYVHTSALRGFAGQLNAGRLAALRHNPAVDYIEQSQRGGIQATRFKSSL